MTFLHHVYYMSAYNRASLLICQAAGRSQEISFIAFGSLRVCLHFKCVFADIVDSKNSKKKVMPSHSGK